MSSRPCPIWSRKNWKKHRRLYLSDPAAAHMWDPIAIGTPRRPRHLPAAAPQGPQERRMAQHRAAVLPLQRRYPDRRLARRH
ncbi:hypothetical protein ACFSTD_12795 [Novosphingobium colocasiae]